MSRELPKSEKSEQALLGSILLDPERLHYVDIDSADFYYSRHQSLFESMLKVSKESKEWDAVILSEYLNREQKLAGLGGFDFLLQLQDSAGVSAYSQHYAKEIKESAQVRAEIKLMEDNLDKAYAGESVADSVIAHLMKKEVVKEYGNDSIVKQWKTAQRGERSSIPTPFPSMDRQTGGVPDKMVTIFTGRSKSGKSMFLAHWYNYLGKMNIPTLAVPLEDKRDVTIKRMAANLGNYKSSVLDAGGEYIKRNNEWAWMPSQDRDIERGIRCLEEVSKLPVYFYDRKCTPEQLYGVATRYKRRYGIKVMFLDGAKDLIRPSGKYADISYDEEISQTLCAIAQDVEIAVVAVHHLTKIDEEHKITVNNIRGSGNIVSDSRAVYALQSSGIDSLCAANNYELSYDEEGRSKMRIFECLSNNHGGLSMKCLSSDLARCQFFDAKKVDAF